MAELILTRDIGGVLFYPYGSEPVEFETSDDRGFNVTVSFTTLAGTALTVRRADTLTEVSTLTSSPVNGRLPSFYAAQGGLVMVTSVDSQIRWSPAYLNLVGAVNDLVLRAEAAERNSAAVAASNVELEARVIDAETRVANFIANAPTNTNTVTPLVFDTLAQALSGLPVGQIGVVRAIAP